MLCYVKLHSGRRPGRSCFVVKETRDQAVEIKIDGEASTVVLSRSAVPTPLLPILHIPQAFLAALKDHNQVLKTLGSPIRSKRVCSSIFMLEDSMVTTSNTTTAFQVFVQALFHGTSSSSSPQFHRYL